MYIYIYIYHYGVNGIIVKYHSRKTSKMESLGLRLTIMGIFELQWMIAKSCTSWQKSANPIIISLFPVLHRSFIATKAYQLRILSIHCQK